MKKISLKQGSLAWEEAKATRVGSSEVFDIIRYYATDSELQNCGLNSEFVREENPYTTAWALYHKVLKDGLYHKGILPPELSDYGHAVEPYGAAVLQDGREIKLKRGEVYIDNQLIASLDVSGVAERIDVVHGFDFGEGHIKEGQKFVCEQKSIMPSVLKNGLPIKYQIQAQYQVTMSRADFFILQIMVLENDTAFERGMITQASRQGLKRLQKHLDGKISVKHLYFANNHHLAALIKTCLNRFFDDVKNRREPQAFLPDDSQKNIVESLRINSFYDKSKTVLCNHLGDYAAVKQKIEELEEYRRSLLNAFIREAKEHNASKFFSDDGYWASFDARGAFLVRAPKEDDAS